MDNYRIIPDANVEITLRGKVGTGTRDGFYLRCGEYAVWVPYDALPEGAVKSLEPDWKPGDVARADDGCLLYCRWVGGVGSGWYDARGCPRPIRGITLTPVILDGKVVGS